jgi:hypothetical protein
MVWPDKNHEKSRCIAGISVEIRTQDISIMDQVYQSFNRQAAVSVIIILIISVTTISTVIFSHS